MQNLRCFHEDTLFQVMPPLDKRWHVIGSSVLVFQSHALPSNDHLNLSNIKTSPHSGSEVDDTFAALSRLNIASKTTDDATVMKEDVVTLPKLAIFSLESLVEGATTNSDTGISDFFLNANPEKDFSWKVLNIPCMLQALHDEGYDITILASLTIDGKPEHHAKPFKQSTERRVFAAHSKEGKNNNFHARGRELRPSQHEFRPHIADTEFASRIPPKDFIEHERIPSNHANLLHKIDILLNKLDIPISVYVSVAYDVYAIPARGMFDLILDQYYDLWAKHTAREPPATLIDPVLSFYCGERSGGLQSDLTTAYAAKRGQYKPADDRAFASNIGLSYLTPELLFNVAKEENAVDIEEIKDTTVHAHERMEITEPEWKYGE